MKKLVLSLAVAAMVAPLMVGAPQSWGASAPAQAPVQNWKEYANVPEGFSIMAPVQPTPSRQTKPGPNGPVTRNSYGVNLENASLIVTVNTLAVTDPRPMAQVYEDTRTAAAAGSNSTLSPSIPVTVNGHQGVEFELTAPTLHSRIRYFVVGRKLYQVGAVVPLGAPFPADVERWFSSFRLLG